MLLEGVWHPMEGEYQRQEKLEPLDFVLHYYEWREAYTVIGTYRQYSRPSDPLLRNSHRRKAPRRTLLIRSNVRDA
jgi:hypothetical protein